MKDARSFSAETWVSALQSLQFRCHDPRRGDMWTFCLSTQALHDLHPEEPFVPAAVFNTFRAAIYSAAFNRMEIADPVVQHELSAADVREGLERLLDQARDRLPEAKRLNRG